MSGHDVHRDLGVYVLDGLEPSDRDRFERHLTACARCRDELAHLRALPPLLDAARREAPSFPSEDSSACWLQRLSRQRRRERYVHFTAGALAGLVVVAIAIGIAVLSRGGGVTYAGVDGNVSAQVRDRPWGMAVELEAEGLRAGSNYVLFAVAEDGHRTYAASWRSTGEETLQGSCYLSADQVSRMELVTDGELVGVLNVT